MNCSEVLKPVCRQVSCVLFVKDFFLPPLERTGWRFAKLPGVIARDETGRGPQRNRSWFVSFGESNWVRSPILEAEETPGKQLHEVGGGIGACWWSVTERKHTHKLFMQFALLTPKSGCDRRLTSTLGNTVGECDEVGLGGCRDGAGGVAAQSSFRDVSQLAVRDAS